MFISYIPDITANKISAGTYIFVSGEDTGTLFTYDFSGKLLKGIKIGEHISDFAINGSNIYAITYHDNSILIVNDNKIIKKLALEHFPQTCLWNGELYILMHDAYFSYISRFDKELNLINTFKAQRQIGDLFSFNGKLIFSGMDYTAVLNKNLNILSNKKSTGNILCKYSNIPLYCEENLYFDAINNVTYPLEAPNT